jgi:hypothetical protein
MFHDRTGRYHHRAAMTDEESPDTDSRRKRLATRRGRTRAAAVIFTIALIALGIATAMSLHNHDKTSAATVDHHRAATNDPAPDSSIATAKQVGPPRAISHDKPLRLWIGGDSLSGSFGPALGQMVGATGVVDARIDYKVGSGLEDLGIRDWYDHAKQEMADQNPDAVMFIIGTNDASITSTYDSNNDGVPDWEANYRDRIDRMMRTFVGGSRHRTVYWLGPPTLGDHTLNKGAYRLGRVMRQEAAKFAPDVVYVNTYRLFSDSHGHYSRSLPNGHGKIQEMRISDDVHFSVDGAQYLAEKLWTLLNARWHIAAQADPSQPIDYTIAKGSNDYVPGVGHYRPTVPSSSSDTTPSSDTSTTLGGSTTTGGVSTTTKPTTSTTKHASSTTTPTTKKTPPKVTPTTH